MMSTAAQGAVLVTGGSGFVGRACVSHLRETRKRVIDVRRDDADRHAHDMVTVGDMTTVHDWAPHLEGVDCVVHTAAIAASGQYADEVVFAVNTQVTQRLAEACAAVGVRRFVFLSSAKVLGEETEVDALLPDVRLARGADVYADSKITAERCLEEIAGKSDLEIVLLRPPMVFGPGVRGNFARLAAAVQRGVPLPFGAVRHNRRSLLGLANLVNLIAVCVDHPRAAGLAVTACDRNDVSTRALLKALGVALDKPARLWPLPVRLLEGTGMMTGRSEMVRRLTRSLRVDGQRVCATLGWQPAATMAEELKRFAGQRAALR